MLLGISPALGRSEASRSGAEVERVAGTGICALSDVEADTPEVRGVVVWALMALKFNFSLATGW